MCLITGLFYSISNQSDGSSTGWKVWPQEAKAVLSPRFGGHTRNTTSKNNPQYNTYSNRKQDQLVQSSAGKTKTISNSCRSQFDPVFSSKLITLRHFLKHQFYLWKVDDEAARRPLNDKTIVFTTNRRYFDHVKHQNSHIPDVVRHLHSFEIVMGLFISSEVMNFIGYDQFDFRNPPTKSTSEVCRFPQSEQFEQFWRQIR